MKEQILTITFSATPEVRVRVIAADDDAELIKEKKKFPFKLDNDVVVTVLTFQPNPNGLKTTNPPSAPPLRTFEFVITAGYIWNGADIPRCLWALVGASKDNDFLIASMVHDYLLEFKRLRPIGMTMPEYRRLTSLIFREILKMQNTPVIKANFMSGTVDLFQKHFNRTAWKKGKGL